MKLKKIKLIKKQEAGPKNTSVKTLMELKKEFKDAMDYKKDIVFVDECMFTYSTLPRKAFAAKGKNICIDAKAGHSETIALVAGIDATDGMVYYDLCQGSVN